MRWIVSLLLMGALWPVGGIYVAGTLEAAPRVLRPFDRRTLVVSLTAQRPLTSLVLQVHIRGAVSAEPNDDGACAGMGVDERGGTQETHCTWLDVPQGTTITRTITFAPIELVVSPIQVACHGHLDVGMPFSLSADGQEIAYYQTIWTAYQPGYCAYIPL